MPTGFSLTFACGCLSCTNIPNRRFFEDWPCARRRNDAESGRKRSPAANEIAAKLGQVERRRAFLRVHPYCCCGSEDILDDVLTKFIDGHIANEVVNGINDFRFFALEGHNSLSRETSQQSTVSQTGFVHWPRRSIRLGRDLGNPAREQRLKTSRFCFHIKVLTLDLRNFKNQSRDVGVISSTTRSPLRMTAIFTGWPIFKPSIACV